MEDESKVAAAGPPPADPLAQIYEHSFEEMRQLVSCKVCVQPMYEPYTIVCGHTFCYSCLVRWFETNSRNKTCPECRKVVTQQPAPAYIVRELARLFTSKPELLPAGETTKEHEELQQNEALMVAKDREDTHPLTGGLFRGCFDANLPSRNPRSGVIDHEDNVFRCPHCHWELEEGYCIRCDAALDLDSVSGGSGTPHSLYERELEMMPYLGPSLHPRLGAFSDSLTSVEQWSSDELSESEDDSSLDSFIERDDAGVDDFSDTQSERAAHLVLLTEPESEIMGPDMLTRPSNAELRRLAYGTDADDSETGVSELTHTSIQQHTLPERTATHNGETASETTSGASGLPDSESDEERAEEDEEDEDDEEEDGEAEQDVQAGAAVAAIPAEAPASRKRRRMVLEDSSSEEEGATPMTRRSPAQTPNASGSQQNRQFRWRNRSRSNRHSPASFSRQRHMLNRSAQA